MIVSVNIFSDIRAGSFGPRRKKTCLRGFANNTGADQPTLLRSLIRAFVIRFFERTICKRGTGREHSGSVVECLARDQGAAG